jgi:hypothetical protein
MCALLTCCATVFCPAIATFIGRDGLSFLIIACQYSNDHAVTPAVQLRLVIKLSAAGWRAVAS